MHRGYIKLWRKGLEHGLFKKPLVWHFWCYCLMRANHRDTETEFNGRPILLKRGSFIMSLRNAAADTGLSIQNIRTALKILENFKMLEKSTHKLTQQATVIRVCKYSEYQKKDDDPNTVINTVLTQCQHSANTALTLDKNVKNEKKVKNVKNNPPNPPLDDEPFFGDLEEEPNGRPEVQEAFESCREILGLSDTEIQEFYNRHSESNRFAEAVQFAVEKTERDGVLEKPLGFMAWAYKNSKTSRQTRDKVCRTRNGEKKKQNLVIGAPEGWITVQ